MGMCHIHAFYTEKPGMAYYSCTGRSCILFLDSFIVASGFLFRVWVLFYCSVFTSFCFRQISYHAEAVQDQNSFQLVDTLCTSETKTVQKILNFANSWRWDKHFKSLHWLCNWSLDVVGLLASQSPFLSSPICSAVPSFSPEPWNLFRNVGASSDAKSQLIWNMSELLLHQSLVLALPFIHLSA